MLGTFSFEPYFKSYLCFTVGSLEISEIAKQSIFFHLRPTPLPSLTAGKAALSRRSGPPPRATSCLLASTRRTDAPHRPHSSRWRPPRFATPPRQAQTVTTSLPPWRARCSTPALDFSRAAALQIPQKASPLVLLPFPHSQSSEHTATIRQTPASLTPPSSRLSAAPQPVLTP